MTRKVSRAPKRRKPYRETPTFIESIRALHQALVKRIGDQGDIASLKLMDQLPAEIKALEQETVDLLRDRHHYSWSDIGHALGVSTQRAQQRFGHQRSVEGKPAAYGTGDGREGSTGSDALSGSEGVDP